LPPSPSIFQEGDDQKQNLTYFYLAFDIAFTLTPVFGMFITNYFDFTLLFLFCKGLLVCSLFINTQLEMKKIHPLASPLIEKESIFSRKALSSATIVFFVDIIWIALNSIIFMFMYGVGERDQRNCPSRPLRHQHKRKAPSRKALTLNIIFVK
jgi:hypothetical protein